MYIEWVENRSMAGLGIILHRNIKKKFGTQLFLSETLFPRKSNFISAQLRDIIYLYRYIVSNFIGVARIIRFFRAAALLTGHLNRF